MKKDDSDTVKDLSVPEIVFKFRNQSLCIKTNIQVLKDAWELQPNFKEKNTGAFYSIIQDNCIFRIVLETYKMLYDNVKGSTTIYKMANVCYRAMIGMEEFADQQQKLLAAKKKFSFNLNKFENVKKVIIANRNRVYAHNDQEYHWFSDSYIELWGMTDQIYNEILDISNICIDYCNELLGYFNKRYIYEYSNNDDIKRIFGIKTERDVEMEIVKDVL